MSASRTVLLAGEMSLSQADNLRATLQTDWQVQAVNPKASPDQFAALVETADAMVCGPVPHMPQSGRLKLLQIPFTGHEWLTPEAVPAGTIVCNTFEHESTIAEHVLLAMLEFQVGLLRDQDPWMRQHSFQGRSINTGPFRRELRAATVGIVGYGHIGREIARRAKAFDMRVLAQSRTIRDEPDLVDEYFGVDGLETLLAASDFVIICAPLSPETTSLINAPRLALMRPDAVLMNVGRAPVVDEAALYAALSTGALRGAMLDVWWRRGDANDPWPSQFPYQKLSNLIMSPHSSAWSHEMLARRWQFVAANLDRFARGESPLNQVFTGSASEA
jgi:phosphoglycerate dehydrogenase-like enzyme